MNKLEGNKSELCKYISTHPIISREKERWEFAKPKELMNRKLIINSNLRVVWKITDSIIKMSDNLTQEDWMDLFNSGIIGLNVAIDKFNPSYNVRFYTYAHWWIKSYILKERDKRVVKHPKFNTLYLEDISNAPDSPHRMPPEVTINNDIVDNLNAKYIIEAVNNILKDDESKGIFDLYFIKGHTGKQIGAVMGLSIRQTYIRINKIKAIIQANMSYEQLKGAINGGN